MFLAISGRNGLVLKREFRLKMEACVPKHDLKGQSVAIICLGISGVAAAKLALARGASLLALDKNETLKPLEAIGMHNRYIAPIAALSVIGLDLGIEIATICSTINKSKAPPHRMQIVHEDLCAVTWVNDIDSKATYAGLMGFREKKSCSFAWWPCTSLGCSRF